MFDITSQIMGNDFENLFEATSQIVEIASQHVKIITYLTIPDNTIPDHTIPEYTIPDHT